MSESAGEADDIREEDPESWVLYEKLDGGVARVTLNRPHRRNAIVSPDMHAVLAARLDTAHDDDEVKVIILAGTVKDFCSGDDVRRMPVERAGLEKGKKLPQTARIRNAIRLDENLRGLLYAPKTIIAACQGAVVGAGMTRAGTLLTQTDDDWNLVLATNLTGPFICSSIAAQRMREAGHGGAIVNIGSISAHGIRSGPPAYAAAKAGLEGLTRNAAIELGRDGIRVNLIVLGTIESEWLLQRKTEEELREIRSSTLTGRLGTPGDVASVVSFLVSEDAGHVTGQLFSVSGGQWLP